MSTPPTPRVQGNRRRDSQPRRFEALSVVTSSAPSPSPRSSPQPCLDVLLEMTFVNAVDAPSLALIVPVLSRGLARPHARISRRKAAKIAGNMCALVADPKDMSPYVPLLIPGHPESLSLDPFARGEGHGGGRAGVADSGAWAARNPSTSFRADPVAHRDAAERRADDGAKSGAAQGLRRVPRRASPLGARSRRCSPRSWPGATTSRRTCSEGHLTLLRFLPLALRPPLRAAPPGGVGRGAHRPRGRQAEPVRDAALSPPGRVFVEEFSHSSASPSTSSCRPSRMESPRVRTGASGRARR